MGHNLLEEDAVLSQLRWLLTSLAMSGLQDWLTPARVGVPSLSPASLGESDAIPADDGALRLSSIRQELGDCTRCRLHATRSTIVFGEGAPDAPVVFVGEGPGFEEDQQGRPFVGRAGKLLDKMIRALGFGREEVYICNVVKCRPPQNRTPDPDEISTCSPFLLQQLEAIHPRVICALGACATQTLLGTTRSISALRARVHWCRGIPLVATFHPAYLLRNPAQKAAAWQDLLELHTLLRAASYES